MIPGICYSERKMIYHFCFRFCSDDRQFEMLSRFVEELEQRSHLMGDVIHLLCESTEQCLEWWAHDLNDEFLYQNIRKKARQIVKWRCPNCGAVFEKAVCYMIGPYGPICPTCKKKVSEKKSVEWERLKKTPVSAIPELVDAWDDERDPSKVMVIPQSSTGSYEEMVFRFKCPKGHHPRVSPYTYLERGCQFCNSKTRTNPDKGYIIDEWPELAKEWVTSSNGKNTPYNTRHNSKQIIRWKCLACGYEWDETPKNRTKNYSACCPNCGKVLGSLGWKYPNIAKEWDTMNKLSAWQVRKQTGFIPSWICSYNPDHKWKVSIISRINGSGCPYCNAVSKSRIELVYYNALKKEFSNAESGAVLSEPVFSHSWTVDILLYVSGTKAVVEYDGAYWHTNKNNHDRKKSLELLKAGFWVIRLRENGSSSLQIHDPKYREIFVNSLSVKVDTVVEDIKATLEEHVQ